MRKPTPPTKGAKVVPLREVKKAKPPLRPAPHPRDLGNRLLSYHDFLLEQFVDGKMSLELAKAHLIICYNFARNIGLIIKIRGKDAGGGTGTAAAQYADALNAAANAARQRTADPGHPDDPTWEDEPDDDGPEWVGEEGEETEQSDGAA